MIELETDLRIMTSAEVIFYIIEEAIRSGEFGVNNNQMWRKPEFVDIRLNEYIDRLITGRHPLHPPKKPKTGEKP